MSNKEYVKVDNKNFYTSINKKYSKYKIPKKTRTLKQICFPKKYELQIPQKFLSEFINPDTPYKGILVDYEIGSGKTCTSVGIAERFKRKTKILVVLPASLKENYRSELRSPCAGNNYLTRAERSLLSKLDPSSREYRDIIKRSDARIDKYYTIYSFNKFIELLKNNRISFANTLLIIDEIHNMVSEIGTYYEILYRRLQEAPSSLRTVIMTATPIFDKPVEIALTMNLLLRDNQLPTGREFIDTFMNITYTKKGPVYEVKNMELFKKYIRGYVSYFRGPPAHVYPRTELNLVKIEMSDYQKNLYRKIITKEINTSKIKDYVNVDISNSFFIGTRMVSNVVFPNGKFGEAGYLSLTSGHMDRDGLAKYCPKFLRILRKIKRCRGTVFVYSSFKEYGGIKTFSKILEHYGFKDYSIHGSGRKRFAVWSGDQDPQLKSEIRAVFNNKNNEYGDKIKIILGSPSIKEGVSLFRIQEVHIIEPYWNMSRLKQVFGRAIRYCSHKDVDITRQLVKVYIYLATNSKMKPTVDEHIMKIALDKEIVNSKFNRALKESAIDCELFKNANVYPGEEDLKCDV